MAISSIGVGSGLPLDELLTNLRAAESAPLALLQNRAQAVENRISGYGAIKSALESFQTAAKALGKPAAFGTHATQVNGEGFTATASAAATAGTYSITVNQLATHQTLTSEGVDSRNRTLSTSDITLSVTVGAETEPRTLTISQNATTLEGIAAAINGEPGLGMRATILNDGSNQPYRLLITATSSGDASTVSAITVSGAAPESEVAQLLSFDAGNPGQTGGLTQTAEGRQALLDINGIAITSQSNTVENAIEGVTLQLAKVTPGTPGTLSVTSDDKPAIKAIESFVSAYNNLQNVIKSLTTYDVESQAANVLTGDSLARRVQTQMRDALNVPLGSGELPNLSQLGVTTDPNTGLLLVDSDRLATAVKDNPAGVQALFSGAGGISERVSSAADLYLKSDGIINTATGGMTSALKDLESQYDSTADRIDQKMENYRRQFVQLDTIVSQMSSVSAYLTQQLSSLGVQKSNS
ncbi:flagellar filament capping protein FliD [Allopusillimonas ginsengisoli]|uniref:flagellar filament capping protein FliD n=1 Tax=Allopusillimonas ginsengisoli TaxID=453575 RepID=UPI0010C23981|nr:flagellar hook-associated protein 2 [Allopusillimonas ginsengisoli]